MVKFSGQSSDKEKSPFLSASRESGNIDGIVSSLALLKV
jgi:hypothetical protein